MVTFYQFDNPFLQCVFDVIRKANGYNKKLMDSGFVGGKFKFIWNDL